MSKTQQNFKSERHKFCTKEVNKIDSIGTYPYGQAKI